MGCGASKTLTTPHGTEEHLTKKSQSDNGNQSFGGNRSRLTERQIKLVQDTWRLLIPSQKKTAMIFYLKLFTLDPIFKEVFSFHTENEGQLEQDERFLFQSRKFMEMINSAVDRLNDISLLVMILKSLGEVHWTKFKIKPEYYEPVGKALIYSISKGLGSLFNDEIGEAWQAMYDLMSGAMISGTKAVQARSQNSL
ncbi:neuroglobin [Nematostella vectensis]|uniref:neuroglobin n=1 Tax=Nematostella vectensis TaxID=45351 RepID=UPI0020771720|nr:neuroglobin [Nematostella vectensis]XP_048585798.1 neuroglobin [Nematostella vectensis]XP_048585799.1 neuroglobin [Nematostella vectensis]XP_048585800.1 neuroglobin [Nematostella vectensis]